MQPSLGPDGAGPVPAEVRRAAWFFAGANAFVAMSLGAGSLVADALRGESRSLVNTAIMVGLLALGLGIALWISRGLAQGREAGRIWFGRWVSIELALAAWLKVGLLDEGPPMLRGGALALAAVAVALYVAKVRLRQRLAQPDVRRALR